MTDESMVVEAATCNELDEASATIRAAGCVVWRISKKGTVKLLLIHRPDYDDWSFPKGKCDEGEDFLDCAIREVAEETNAVGTIGPELPTTRYVDGRGRHKIVRYWAMKYQSGTFEPNDEVDEIRWVKLGAVAGVLTYEHDAAVILDLHEVF